MAKKSKAGYVKAKKPKPLSYYTGKAHKPKNAPTYTQREYTNQYADRIAAALDKVENYGPFEYNPLQDASYKALARIYDARGAKAARDTMGDAAAMNGGYASSYATTAAAQARNQYNQEFAALVPELEQNAYQRYSDAFNMNVTALEALQGAEQSDYGKYRDMVGDDQWLYGQNYQKYRDDMSDYQWKYGVNYQKWRDLTGDYQWAQQYNRDVYTSNRDYKKWKKEFEEQKRNNAADRAYTNAQIAALKDRSSGGSGGSSGGYTSGYSGGSSGGYSGGDKGTQSGTSSSSTKPSGYHSNPNRDIAQWRWANVNAAAQRGRANSGTKNKKPKKKWYEFWK